MSVQNEVGLITLAGIGLVAVAFLYVIANSGRAADPSQVEKGAYAVRRWWFVALLVLGVGVTWATLRPFPIPDQRAPTHTPQVVDAVGYQWYWELSSDRLDAGVPVEFRVTSADVNHGFAIYGPHGRLVTQTQAMPGITNRLIYTFTQSGKYRVLCLEYCGLAHHGMSLEFDVLGTAERQP